VPDPKTGLLVARPSVSPENSFLDKNGKMVTIFIGLTMDREIIFELFQNCISAAEILEIDKTFSDTLQSKIQQMPPLQVGAVSGLLTFGHVC
jgi:alpha-L-fucosidase 2